MRYPNVREYDESGQPPPLESGHYTIKLTNAVNCKKDGEFFIDQKSGFKYWLFIFKVEGKPNNLLERFFFDEENYEYYPQNMGKFKQLLLACGRKPDSEETIDSLIGEVFTVDVSTSKPINGKIYNNIVEYKSTGKLWDENTNDDPDLPF